MCGNNLHSFCQGDEDAVTKITKKKNHVIRYPKGGVSKDAPEPEEVKSGVEPQKQVTLDGKTAPVGMQWDDANEVEHRPGAISAPGNRPIAVGDSVESTEDFVAEATDVSAPSQDVEQARSQSVPIEAYPVTPEENRPLVQAALDRRWRLILGAAMIVLVIAAIAIEVTVHQLQSDVDDTAEPNPLGELLVSFVYDNPGNGEFFKAESTVDSRTETKFTSCR